DNVVHGTKQEVHPFLFADDADIRHEVWPALLPSIVRGHFPDTAEIRSGSDREDALRAHLASLNRDAPERLVRRNRYVGHPESQALQPDKQTPKRSPALELRFEKLGVEIVVVEDEFYPEQKFPERSDEKDEVGRVAGMDDVETTFPVDPHGEHELPE